MLTITNPKDGREYTFSGNYAKPKEGDFILNNHGSIQQVDRSGIARGIADGIRAILTRVPRKHTFGGVVFEETDEERISRIGDFYLGKVNQVCADTGGCRTVSPVTILRPVSLE